MLWDRSTGEPVGRAIVWQDRRTADLCESLKAAGHVRKSPVARDSCSIPISPAPNCSWLLDSIPDGTDARGPRRDRVRHDRQLARVEAHRRQASRHGRDERQPHLALQPAHALVGSGDARDARCAARLRARTSVPSQLSPSEGICAILDGSRDSDHAGIAGDQQAALFGQSCFEPGMAKNTYGTGCFLLMTTGDSPIPSRHRLVTTVAWQRDTYQYALEGSVFVAGAVVQWLRDGLGFIRSSAEIEPLAASVPDGDGVYLVPAFTGLGSPHWDPHARGTMVGLSRGMTRAHIARAALEAIAFQSAEVLAAMQKDASRPLIELRVDGGATANNLLMQFQADLLGVPVVRPKITETTALGAAYLAGLGVGFWSSLDELSDNSAGWIAASSYA